MKTWITRHDILIYYLITLLITWSIQLTLVSVKNNWADWQVPFGIHYMASFGPAIAALIVTRLTGGRSGIKELWRRILHWRVGWGWALFCILSPLVAFLLAMPVVRLVKGEWPDLRLLGQANYMPYLGAWVILLWIVTFGFGEEIGWRGFALPRLQKSNSVSRSTLILALMWALWHIPAFFYLDTLEELGLIMLPGFLIGVLFAAVIFTWIYNGTGGSVLMVAIWHGLFDLVTASKAGQDIVPIVTTALVILWVLFITNTRRPWGFQQVKKHVV